MLYENKTGRRTRRSNRILRHPEHEWMIGNIDREIVGDAKGPGILEIKCPGIKTFAKCKREGAPDYYCLQLQHYLAVTGRAWGALAVFNSELWEMACFDMERDEKLIDLIIRRDGEFWQSVLDGRPPAEEDPPHGPELPPVQGDARFARIETDEFRKAAKDYWESDELLEEAKGLKDGAEERIKNLMAINNASIAESDGSRFHHRPQEGKRRFDLNAFRMAWPDIDIDPFFRTGKESMAFRAYRINEEATMNE
jgi:predicted phage-related endonuclease